MASSIKSVAAAVLLGCCGVAYCDAELGSRSIWVSNFNGVTLRVPGDLYITQNGTQAMVVEAEPKVLARIQARVHKGMLIIDAVGGGFQTQKPLRFRLGVKSLRDLALESSGDIHAGSLRVDMLRIASDGSGSVSVEELIVGHLQVELTGSGEIRVAGGRVTEQIVSLDGSGDYRAPRLRGQTVLVSLSGSGSAYVMATGRLHAGISGSGDIVYFGHPRVSESVSGSGQVIASNGKERGRQE
ncbi:MAG: DUF2807 domain-containing protein [Betaproteobacteria bacterium]|nr:DUF2807 domain-containing protein [Betaproteobacteria bacterium]